MEEAGEDVPVQLIQDRQTSCDLLSVLCNLKRHGICEKPMLKKELQMALSLDVWTVAQRSHARTPGESEQTPGCPNGSFKDVI